MCATDRLRSRFGKSEVLHLALLNQLFYRSRDLFNRHVRVNAVLIEQIDDIDVEPLQGSLGNLLDVRGPTVQPGLLACGRIKFEPELRGDHHLLTKGSEGFANKQFVRERAVDFGSIEECDAAFDCCSNQRDPVLLDHGGPEAKAQPHAAQSKSRNLQVAFSEFALLHSFSSRSVSRLSRLGSKTAEAVARSPACPSRVVADQR